MYAYLNPCHLHSTKNSSNIWGFTNLCITCPSVRIGAAGVEQTNIDYKGLLGEHVCYVLVFV